MLMQGGWMNAASDEELGPVERRYLHWLQRASTADIERVHVPMLARLSADQRLALMRAAATAARLPQRALEEPGMATPARAARCLSQAQARVPGLLPQLLGLLPGPALRRRLALPALAGALAGAFAASVMAGALEDGAPPDAGPLGAADLTGLPDADSSGLTASDGDLASAQTDTVSVDPGAAFADSADLLSAVGDFFV
jgi:hypothetical protein